MQEKWGNLEQRETLLTNTERGSSCSFKMALRKKEDMYELETAVETHNVKTEYGE